MTPLLIELFAGLHGWGEGFLLEGWRVVGFDIVDMCATLGQPRAIGCELVLQDVLTLHGSQFRNASAIAASPPCQAYSYRAMPWKRAKALPPPSNELFDACFRIQREASEAAGHHIPMVVENVNGAQRWVGRAKWHYGSFYLWGDVPALMPIASGRKNTSGKSNIGTHERLTGPGRPLVIREDSVKFGGGWWHDTTNNLIRKASSRSTARKAASAMIAKIPLALSQHIARCLKP